MRCADSGSPACAAGAGLAPGDAVRSTSLRPALSMVEWAAMLFGEPDGGLDGVEVERVDDDLDSLADHRAGLRIHLDLAGFRDLLDWDDNVHLCP